MIHAWNMSPTSKILHETMVGIRIHSLRISQVDATEKNAFLLNFCLGLKIQKKDKNKNRNK